MQSPLLRCGWALRRKGCSRRAHRREGDRKPDSTLLLLQLQPSGRAARGRGDREFQHPGAHRCRGESGPVRVRGQEPLWCVLLGGGEQGGKGCQGGNFSRETVTVGQRFDLVAIGTGSAASTVAW